MEGYDQMMNVILSQSHERVFSLEEPVSVVQLGLYILRGDNVYMIALNICCTIIRAIVGLVDEEIEGNLDYESLRAAPLPPIIH